MRHAHLEYADTTHERQLSDDSIRRWEAMRAKHAPCHCGSVPGGYCKACEADALHKSDYEKFQKLAKR